MKTCLAAALVSASLAACGGGYSNGAIEHVKPMNLFPSGGEVSFAVKPGKDAEKGFVVTDYYGRNMRIPVTVKGVKDTKNVTARVLSFEKDLEPVPVNVKDGRFTLAKPDAYSAAFIVTFDL